MNHFFEDDTQIILVRSSPTIAAQVNERRLLECLHDIRTGLRQANIANIANIKILQQCYLKLKLTEKKSYILFPQLKTNRSPIPTKNKMAIFNDTFNFKDNFIKPVKHILSPKLRQNLSRYSHIIQQYLVIGLRKVYDPICLSRRILTS